MQTIKTTLTMAFLAILVLGMVQTAYALKDKFEKEVDKEQDAVKLVREVQRGGYDIIKTDELKKMIDDGKDILIIDTMPYEKSYKKSHIPGAKLIPIGELESRLDELDPAKPTVAY